MAQEVVEAPIPGKILEVYVKEGDKVQEGDIICTLESMKMENPIMAPVSGVITQIKASPDQASKSGETIAVIEF
jgi:biotin carboxyl carrier protein